MKNEVTMSGVLGGVGEGCEFEIDASNCRMSNRVLPSIRLKLSFFIVLHLALYLTRFLDSTVQ
jgi:hypothetical protein